MNAVPTPPTRTKRFFDFATVLVFVALLLAPTVDLFVRDDEARGPGPELRRAAPRPERPTSLRELATFPKRYEPYWNDTFGLRDKLLRAHSIFKVFGLGVSPDPNHVVGKDRWIFNAHSEIVDTWRGALPMTTEELEGWRRKLERRRDAARELGAHYLFVFAPDKPSIYPEFLPDRFNKVGPSRLDQFFEHMRATSDVDVIDVRPRLIAEKQHDRPGDYVYYRLGTHWESRGGIAAFNELVEHLRPRFPSLRALPFEAHKPWASGRTGDSEARNMYIEDLIPQPEIWHVVPVPKRHRELTRGDRGVHLVTSIDDPTLPRVVMYHDSFGPFFETQWAETCSYFAMHWVYDWDLLEIAAADPDLIIDLVVERSLYNQDPNKVVPSETWTLAKRFSESTDTLFALTPQNPELGLRGLHGATFSAESDERGAFVRLSTRSRRDGFGLQGFPAAADQRIVVRGEIELEQAGEIRLFWRCEGDPAWSQQRSVAVTLEAGTHVFHLPLVIGAAPLTDMLLDPLPKVGTCKLRALEMRVEPARPAR